jgi:SAM-dependent methyltransferase
MFTPSNGGNQHDGDRRPYETHWRMNPVTRGIFDDAIAAAVAARGDRPFDLVLDVGCGRQSNIVFPNTRYTAGTDLDAVGLAGNQWIDVGIETNIVEADLPEASVDAIACIYVLEHVEKPDVVFAKMARALRPDGVMVVAFPNVSMPKAKVTRWTPLWFHSFVYRRLLGRNDPNTGDPFETVLDGAIRPDRVERLAEICGLDVVYRRDFEDNKQRQLRERFHVVGGVWSAIRSGFRLVTGNRMDPEYSDVAFAFRRRSGSATGELAEAIAAAPAPSSSAE